jgi:MOSC domain-containing protein YiiM
VSEYPGRGLPDLRTLTTHVPRSGRLEAIVLRTGRRAPAVLATEVRAIAGQGLDGDRAARTRSANAAPSRRQVTLIQAEHLPVIARFAGRDEVLASEMRRNLVIAGINLLAARSPFKDQTMHLRIGAEVVLKITDVCAPCSRMEEVLGDGGYAAMRGHGGLTATVLVGGMLRVGDAVRVDLAT